MKRNELLSCAKALIKRGLESELDYTRDMTEYLVKSNNINDKLDLRKFTNNQLQLIIMNVDGYISLGY